MYWDSAQKLGNLPKSSLNLFSIISFLFVSLLIVGCSDSSDRDPLAPTSSITGLVSTVFDIREIETSDRCEFGGYIVDSGPDANLNGLLDKNELFETDHYCHKEEVEVVVERQNVTDTKVCSDGGASLSAGYDANSNDALESDETTETIVYCKRSVSLTFSQALAVSSEIQRGEQCEHGGEAIRFGVDQDNSGSLEKGEITSIEYRCYDSNELITYYNDAYCYEHSCGSAAFTDQSVFAGREESKPIAQFFDDGAGGEFEITIGEGAPEWLKLELLDALVYVNTFDKGAAAPYIVYEVGLVQSVIPKEAIGSAYEITFVVNDGEKKLSFTRNIFVQQSFAASLEVEELTLKEAEQKVVKVTFDEPIGKNSNLLDGAFVQAYAKPVESGELYYQSGSDLEVRWLNDEFYEGQTFAHIVINAKDDFLPEDDEAFEVILSVVYRVSEHEYEYESYELDTLIATIEDDGDAAINATLSFEQASIKEGTSLDSDNLTEMPFTLTFSKPVPESGSISLQLSDIEGKEWSDVGFSCSSYSSFCSTGREFNVLKGDTSIEGVIYIQPDSRQEKDVEVSLEAGSSGSFALEGINSSFTLIDDDDTPSIGFAANAISAYHESPYLHLPVELTSETETKVSFDLQVSADSDLVEGVDFSWGVSTPIIFEPGVAQIAIPVVLHVESYDSNASNVEVELINVNGAELLSDDATIQFSLDEVEPFYAENEIYKLRTNSGTTDDVSVRASFLSQDEHVYQVGNISEADVVAGQTAQGDSDLYVAKFTVEGEYVWGRQFGTDGYDSLYEAQLASATGDLIVQHDNDLYRVSSAGDVTSLNAELARYDDLRGVVADSEGNFYVLIDTRYSWSASDHDSDGFRSSLRLMKFDASGNRVWLQGDLSEISSSYSSFEMKYPDLSMTDSGDLVVIGGISRVDGLGEVRLGYDDIVVIRFDSGTGAAQSYVRFGTSGDDESPSVIDLDGKLIALFEAKYHSYMDGVDEDRTELVRVELNGSFELASQKTLESDGVVNPQLFKNSDGTILRIGGSGSYYGNNIYGLVDSSLEWLNGVRTIEYGITQELIASSDGGYYFIDAHRNVGKLDSNAGPRLQ